MAKSAKGRAKKMNRVPPPLIYPAKVSVIPAGDRTGHAHPSCYAKCLADCSPGMSREHYVSANVLRSLGPFVVNDQKRGWVDKVIGIESLTARILCERHNNNLSPLDVVTGDFVDAVRGVTEGVRHGGRGVFNGIDVERAILKIMCGFAVGSGETLRDEWVRILFGVQDLRSPSGLHMNVRVGDTQDMPLNQYLSFEHARRGEGERSGMALVVNGYRFLLTLDDKRLYDESEIGRESVLRPAYLRWQNTRHPASYWIRFGWPEGESAGDGITTALTLHEDDSAQPP